MQHQVPNESKMSNKLAIYESPLLVGLVSKLDINIDIELVLLNTKIFSVGLIFRVMKTKNGRCFLY